MLTVLANYDRTTLLKLLLQFRDATKRSINVVLADEIQSQLLDRGLAFLDASASKRLARWCKTDGPLYGDGMQIAREISRLLFGYVLDREVLGT